MLCFYHITIHRNRTIFSAYLDSNLMKKNSITFPWKDSQTKGCKFKITCSVFSLQSVKEKQNKVEVTDCMADLIILNEEQLRKLATVIYYREVAAIKNIQFGSEQERVKYLRDCRSNHESIMGLLDAGVGLKGGFQDDQIRDPIAHDIFSYVEICVNSALQMVRNYTLRTNYLKKIKEHSNFLMDALRKLNPKSLENAKGLAMEAVQHKNAMLEYTKKHQSGPSRVFSKWVKEKGWTFEELVKRYQTKIGYSGPFKNLKEVEKLQVYEEIIEASGRGRAVANRLWTGLGVVGITVLLFTAGIMVWDIYSSEQKLETATRNTVQIASAVGGAMLGKVVAAALVPRLVGVVAPSFFVGMMGIILGVAGAFILGAFTGWLVDLIFSSGSDEAFSTDGHHCYVAPMPDGKVLARQIAHQDSMVG